MLRSARNIIHNQFFSIWPFGGGEFNTNNTHTAARMRMFESGSGDLRINKGINNSDAPRYLRGQPHMVVRANLTATPGDVYIRQRIKNGTVFSSDRLYARILAMGPRGRSFDFGLGDYTKSAVMEAAANSRSVTNVSNANPGVVTVSGSTKPFSDDDLVYIEGVGGINNVNHQFFIVKNSSSVAPWTFQLYRYIGGVATPFDTTSLGSFTTAGIVYKPRPVMVDLDIMLPPQANTDLFFYPFINPSISGTFILMAAGLWSLGVNEDPPEWEYRTEAEEWELMQQFLKPIYNGDDPAAVSSGTTAPLAWVVKAPPGGWHKNPTPVFTGSSPINIIAALAGTAITGTGTATLGGVVYSGSGAGVRFETAGITWSAGLTQSSRYVLTGSSAAPVIVLDADE